MPGASEAQAREAKVVAMDREHDLALLRISGAALPTVALGNGKEVRDGQSIAFTGFPLGNALGSHPVTHRGIVSAVSQIALPPPTARQLDAKTVSRLREGSFEILQLDATAYPGNSGSPLLDAESGLVIGIVNMVYVKGTKESAIAQPTGITYAIPGRFLAELLARP